jgi:hypothetical protein
MRFRKNYFYFLENYTGKNLGLYMDQFVHDHTKLAQQLYGDEAAKLLKDYARRMPIPCTY